MDLHIFDVSPFCYAGGVNARAFLDGPIVNVDGRYSQLTAQAGGISLIFNKLRSLMLNGDDFLFCVDRKPTIKQGMRSTYKSNRTHPSDIMAQKDLAELILDACGFTVLAEEGYEADDFIYSAVQAYKDKYHHIYVYTVDSDLYLLVSDTVSIEPAHSRAKTVTRENYEQVARSKEFTPYNTLSFLKVLYGDTADSIEGLPADQAYDLYHRFNTAFFRPLLGNKDFMRATLEAVADWSLPQFDLVYPLTVAVPEQLNIGDVDTVQAFGSAMKNRKFGSIIKSTPQYEEALEKMAELNMWS